MDLDRRRVAPVIVSAFLGAVILIAATQVFGRAMTSGLTDTSSAAAQMSQPLENHEQPERLRVLTGIIAYTDPSQGFAIIGSSVENTYLARPGELLPDGSSIREIYPSHVVLAYGGRLETVGMYQRGKPTGAAYVQTPPLLQQARLEAVDVNAVTAGDAMSRQAPRPGGEPPGDPRPIDTRASEPTGSGQSRPEVPLPSALDPAEELSDDRRQQPTSRRRPP
jgi:type II secretory pathway component PulC